MTDSQPDDMEEISRKSRRMQAARKQHTESAWYGLSMFGLVGWAVAVPLVAGIALGRWIDTRWPGTTSWTMILLLAGAALGCMNAWYWISRESGDD